MAFAIFFAGLFLGTIFGFVIMALLAASGDRSLGEELQIIGSGFACAYPPTRKMSPRVENRPPAYKPWLVSER